nr:peroxidase-like protein 2 [Halisarca dujardinii]
MVRLCVALILLLATGCQSGTDDFEIPGDIQVKLDILMADAHATAADIVDREMAADDDDDSREQSSPSVRPSPSDLHHIMTLAKPMTQGMVHGAVKTEIALANVSYLFREDPSFQLYASDERFRRTVFARISQNCVDQLAKQVDCSEVQNRMAQSLPEFSLDTHYAFDGTCNNKVYTTNGATPKPLKRLLPAVYQPPPSTPRTRSRRHGHLLPGARDVSNALGKGKTETKDPVFTFMGVTWGQFLDHDVDLTCAGNFDADQSCMSICESSPRPGSACLPIKVGASDSELSCRAGKCIPFTRSCPACTASTGYPTRNQINQITSYVDAGMVYGGPDPKEPLFWKTLADLNTGKMIVQKSSSGTDLPPNATVKANKCVGGCFQLGDTRANEVTGLTALHTIFLREHNRLVDELAAINPLWSPTELYLTARKIVAAQIQRISYAEFLPLLLGRQLSHYTYSPRFDASTSNAFATASFRYAHSSVPEKFEMVNQLYEEVEPLNVFDAYFDTTHLRKPHTLDNILRGMSLQDATKVDGKFSDSVRNRLFEPDNKGCGLDLLALNLQRGRDHGLPTYNQYRHFVRQYCGVTRGSVSNFDELAGEMSHESIYGLKSVYSHVDDIDLYAGGLAENLFENAPTGPTFWCLNKLQFIHWRHGDRLFYEHPAAFTARQRQEIERITLAKILCRNGDNIDRIPREVMKRSDSYLPVDCNTIPGIDIGQWQGS